jgi:hypothetical protein
MQATTKAQHAVAVADWYGRAKLFPQHQPQTLDEITAYTNRYGVAPDGEDSAPWLYQTNPEDLTPWNWQPPVSVLKGMFYDPRTGETYMRGSKPDNDLDPTSPTFVEPPELT